MKLVVSDLARNSRRKERSAHESKELDTDYTPVGPHVEHDLAIKTETDWGRVRTPAQIQNAGRRVCRDERLFLRNRLN
jgi:hypothetical protein